MACEKCGYSKSGICKDGIRVCLDCGAAWPKQTRDKKMDEKDFQAIRQALIDGNEESCGSVFCSGVPTAAKQMAEYFQKTYPETFNKEKFLQ